MPTAAPPRSHTCRILPAPRRGYGIPPLPRALPLAMARACHCAPPVFALALNQARQRQGQEAMVQGIVRLGKGPRLFELLGNGQGDLRPLLVSVAMRQLVSQLSPPPWDVRPLLIALLHRLSQGGQRLCRDVGLLDHAVAPIEAGPRKRVYSEVCNW